MEVLAPNDFVSWARKPRSQKALDFVIELANDKEAEFVDILNQLKKDGRTDGFKLLQKWDYANQSWVKA